MKPEARDRGGVAAGFGAFLAYFAALVAALGGLFLAWQLRPQDGWSWLASEGRLADEGHETAKRFGYADLWELTFVLDDPFAASTRAALSRWEAEVGKWEEVTRLVGPPDLLDLSGEPGGGGAPHAVSAYAPAADAPSAPSVDAAVRTSLRERPDARGWFFDRDERKVHVYLGWEGGAPSVERLLGAARTAGLYPNEDAARARSRLLARPLWPKPAVASLQSGWRAGLVGALAILLVGFFASFFPAAAKRRRSARRVLVGACAAAGGVALPFIVAPSLTWRVAGLGLATAAATPCLLTFAATSGRAFGKRAPVAPWLSGLGILSFVLLLAAVAGNARHRGVWLTADEGAAAPLGFVVIEADLEEPVVLGEMARFTDSLRAAPEVADAWSPADAFLAAREGFAGRPTLPPDKAGVRRLWQRAKTDGALALALAAGRDAALVAVRLRPEVTPAARRAFGARLAAHLETHLRGALLPANVEDAALPAGTRVLGRGILAGDAKERLANLARASGAALSADQVLGLERVTRQAAFVPTADPARLADAVEVALEDAARAGKGLPLLARSAVRRKLAVDIAHQPWESGIAELRALLEGGSPRTEADAAALAGWLFPRVLALRFDAAAELNLKALHEATGLPVAGDHARAVEGALVQGMGPVVGLPVAPETRGACHLRAFAADAWAADRELGRLWGSRVLAALAAAVAVVVLLWVALMGIEGLTFGALSFGPTAAVALTVPTDPASVALPFLLVLGAALGAGWSLAVAWASPFVRKTEAHRHGRRGELG